MQPVAYDTSVPDFITIMNTRNLKLEELFRLEAITNIYIDQSITTNGAKYYVSGLLICKKYSTPENLISVVITEEIEVHSPFPKRNRITRESKLIEMYGEYFVTYIFLSSTPIEREIYDITERMDTELDITVICTNMKGDAMFETLRINSISISDTKRKISAVLLDYKSKLEVIYYHLGTTYHIEGRPYTVEFPSYLFHCNESEIKLLVIMKVETFEFENTSENEFDVCIFSFHKS